MKANSKILALITFGIAAIAMAGQAVAAPKPDLVITQFGLKSWGVCATDKTVFSRSSPSHLHVSLP